MGPKSSLLTRESPEPPSNASDLLWVSPSLALWHRGICHACNTSTRKREWLKMRPDNSALREHVRIVIVPHA
jgi:hypothetical protein